MSEFVSHKEEVKEEMKRKLQMALNAVGMDAVSTSSSVCPVDTGRLKNSITWATKTHCNMMVGETAVGNVGEDNKCYIGTNVEYAPYQEFGTATGIPAKHFLQYGASAHASQYKQIIQMYLSEE